jgi:hypothetical protein
MGLSTYAANRMIDHFTRGVVIAPPARVFVSLHPDSSVEGENEVTLANWPGYARVDTALGGAVETGFSPAAAKDTKNLLQLVFPTYDGVGPIALSHFAIWDAPVGGNPIWYGALLITKNLLPTDECAIHPGDLEFSVD